MKYVLTILFGFLLGAAAGLALLYVNPLTQSDGARVFGGDAVYAYGSPITSELAFTHGRALRLPAHPPGIAELWENTINKSALSVVVLRSAGGEPAALASRLSYPDESTNFLTRGALLNDDWLVSLPGQGSLFITAQSNWWPLLKEALIPVWYLNRPWSGPSVYAPTVGPDASGRGIARGASGVFAGRSGTATERYQIEAFDERAGPRQAYIELSWSLTD